MVIGITGSIASGKSLVTNYLKQKNYKVIDCDKIAHEVLEKECVIKNISDVFPDVLINGKIDRTRLAKIVFNDMSKKTLLENITMPYIIKEIKNQLTDEKLIFLDAPTLLENNLLYLVDKLIVIKTSKDIQLNRLMLRDNIDVEYATKKINSQWPIEKKIEYADYIIDNDQSVKETYKQIETILSCFKETK